VFLGTFNAAKMFWYPSPHLYGQFLQSHGVVFALTYTVNCETLYRHVCAFPNHVQSIEFTTGRLHRSCRNISRMINGNKASLPKGINRGGVVVYILDLALKLYFPVAVCLLRMLFGRCFPILIVTTTFTSRLLCSLTPLHNVKLVRL
jgi:hypothetical protein